MDNETMLQALREVITEFVELKPEERRRTWQHCIRRTMLRE